MKIRSRALFTYLQQAGVLNDTPEVITLAKKRYRRLYKMRWKKRSRPRKEIRFEITLRQFQAINANAVRCAVKPTTYCKNMVLSAVETHSLIPRRDVLLQVLQHLGMAITTLQKHGMSHEAITRLTRAEQQLLTYITAV